MTLGEDRRRQSSRARLARLGFADPSAAVGLAAEVPEVWLEELSAVADPDRALVAVHQLMDGSVALLSAPESRSRIFGVLGASAALGDFLVRDPQDLLEPIPGSFPEMAAHLSATVGDLSGEQASAALHHGYLELLCRIAAADVTAELELEDVAAALADLASAALHVALDISRGDIGPEAGGIRLAIIGMGKCGGRELNYVSDVDVIFVVADSTDEAGLAVATRLARGVIQVCAPLWQVDAALRPEGKRGPLVRTLASHLAYYDKWASTWEFQALLKARAVAGDEEVGRSYVESVAPLVWRAADREGFVADVQAMRRRVEAQLAPSSASRELKLGPGGLRDVEFAVQLLQLVHGRSDDSVRSPTTLTALDQLSAGGYVGRDDAAQLSDAYRFLRTLEHRLQLYRLRRTHTLPTDEVELRRLGRAMGFHRDPVGELDGTWQRHAREIRRLHEKLFYRPLLAAVARLPGEQARLTPEAAVERLVALGYADPEQALRHIEALTSGVSRRAAIQKTLLPVMLGWFADSADADGGLLAFRQVSEALGSTHWYLRLLRDEGVAAQRMARLLASSRYATDLLMRAPEAVEMLADDQLLQPRPLDELLAELAAARPGDPVQGDAAVGRVRALRRRELFRIATADVLGLLDTEAVGRALTEVTVAALAGALEIAGRSVQDPSIRLAVIAMGRLGGREQGYGSDADVLFVYEALPGADENVAGAQALAVATEMRRLLALPAPDPALEVDAALRPEGRQGPLVRSLASYAAYYERWSNIWESQALLRARPVAGDADLGERFAEMVSDVRWPSGGLDEHTLREIRRIKARVEAERLPRGADPALHTKLGPGGLADVEWTVQLLQLRHAHEAAELRTTGTMQALDAAVRAAYLEPSDAAVLSEAWHFASRVRNAVVLSRGRVSDQIPADLRDLDGIARIVGYSPAHSGEFLEDYRRITRRCRTVVERVFYR